MAALRASRPTTNRAVFMAADGRAVEAGRVTAGVLLTGEEGARSQKAL
jgi:hypothetical protein